jgi:uncharacterized protein
MDIKPYSEQSNMLVPSRFNVDVTLPDGRVAVYNTATGCLVRLPRDVWHKYLTPGCTLKNDSENTETLRNRGLLVALNVDEFDLLRIRMESARFGGSVGITIVPTFACNLSCAYCFQGGIERKEKRQRMTRSVEEGVVRFVAGFAAGEKCVSVNWIGGEPLLAIDTIERLSLQLKALFKRAKIRYGSCMSTNGLLLTSTMAATLAGCAVTNIILTIDVPSTIKNDSEGNNTLKKALDCAADASEFLTIGIKINVSEDIEPEFDAIYKGITERDLHQRMSHLRIQRVKKPECGFSESACRTCQPRTFVNCAAREYRKAADLGIPVKDPISTTAISGCGATRLKYTVIGPDGWLYKCDSNAGLRDRAYGTIFDSHVKDMSNLVPWLSYDWFKYEECRECVVLPQCAGGCPSERLYSPTLASEEYCWWQIRGGLELRIKEYVVRCAKESSGLYAVDPIV